MATTSKAVRAGKHIAPAQATAPRRSVAVSALSAAEARKEVPQARERTNFLIEMVGGGAALARLLDVSRGQPSRWSSGDEQPSPRVAKELLDLDHVVARANLVWSRDVAQVWLTSANSFLDGARPIDVLRLRGAGEVLDALDAAYSGAFG